MAALDSKFYRILFKAVGQFKQDSILSSTQVSESDKTYFVFKKPGLKLFRLLAPWYEGSSIKDDNQLIDRLFIDRKTNQALINLAELTSPSHPDQQVLDEWDKLNSLPYKQQEKAQNQLAEKVEKMKKQETSKALNLAPARAKPGIKPPGLILDLASKAKQFIIRHPIIPVSFFSGLVGSIVATGVSGPGAAVPGFIGGSALPSLVKIGLMNRLPGFSNQPPNTEKYVNVPAISQLTKILGPAVVSNIWLWVIVLGIIILLPLLFMLLQTTAQVGPEGVGQDSTQAKQDKDLLLSMTGPGACIECRVNNEQDITYQINLTYRAVGNATIEISSKLPDNTRLQDISDSGQESSGTVIWQIDNLPSNQSKTVNFTLTPTKSDTRISNVAQAKIIKVANKTSTNQDSNIPPSENTCNNKYSSTILKNPLRLNFGDPACNFTKDDLYTLLKNQDPQNADFWFFKVIPCESSYNPNEFFGGSPDPAGAWGLYQMGRSKNGPYDKGDVIWPTQTINAVNYNKTVLFLKGLSIESYWECAR